MNLRVRIIEKYNTLHSHTNTVGVAVTTVEGIGTSANMHDIQKKMVECDGSQCGYCSPGMVALRIPHSHLTDLSNSPVLPEYIC